jgi:hypothetical protein
MATTCSSATDGGVDHGGSSSNERQSMRPTFGMKKGVVQRAGHILWKGKYIDQNEFYKVGPDFFTFKYKAEIPAYRLITMTYFIRNCLKPPLNTGHRAAQKMNLFY